MAAVIRGDVKILAKSVVDVVFTNASQRPSKMQFGDCFQICYKSRDS